MSTDRTQCGLASLLPMSCRIRAEEFARLLQQRLRSLGDNATGTWPITDEQFPHWTHTDCEAELVRDFQLEPESPSSPIDKPDDQLASSEAKSDERLYGDIKERILCNSSTSSTTLPAFSEERQLTQHDSVLYSPINVDDCLQRSLNSITGADEVDCDLKIALDPVSVVNSGIYFNFESPNRKFNKNAKQYTEVAMSRDDGADINFISPVTDVRKDIMDGVISNTVEVSRLRLPDTIIGSFHTKVKCDTNEDSQRVRRCKSLKTTKTPPDTPGRKKIVRFADVLGLDLADVKTYMDEIPVVPKSAYEDLLNADFVAWPSSNSRPATKLSIVNHSGKFLTPLFQQPTTVIGNNFNDVLTANYVCLEATSTVVEGEALAVCGFVRVRNLDFHKSVHVRYTLDGWRTHLDLSASYVVGSCNGFSDSFQFLLYAPSIQVGQKLEFAIRYQCKGCQYWDNNLGANYSYQCCR